MSAPHPIYHLDVEVRHGRARVSLNGFPLMLLAAGDGPRSSAPPVNPYLVGRNEVFVDLMPESEDDLEFADFEKLQLRGSVRRFAKGDVVGPESGDIVAQIEIPDGLREQEARTPPLSFSVPFDSSDAPSFADELVDAPPERDRQAVLDYGMRLVGITADGDADRLLREMQPKVDAYARAYDEPTLAFRNDLLDHLRGAFFPHRPETDFGRAELRAQPCCGGRLWRITRRGAPLLRTAPDPEGARDEIPIFVARRDGRFRIVR
jgi:hypothetical protein